MSGKSTDTKERILDRAQDIILRKGFSATSLDEIIEDSEITKGGFFYHYKGKSDLALCLIQRYLHDDEKFFRDLFSQADELVDDSYQRMLVFLKLLADSMCQIPGIHPGCLVAAFVYESQYINPTIRKHVEGGLLVWRAMFKERIDAIITDYPSPGPPDSIELADMLICIIEGAFITSRTLKSREIVGQQILQYRNYLKYLFRDGYRPS